MASAGGGGSRRDSNIKANLAFIYGRKHEDLAHDPDKRTLLRSETFVDPDQIADFTGDFAFLSPLFECKVNYKGYQFPSFQHAFEASKITSRADAHLIQQIIDTKHIREVKRFLKHLDLNEWKERSMMIAEDIMRDKFIRNRNIRTKLMETGRRTIVYCNDFGDHVWGMSKEFKGQNKLGKVIEKIRSEIESGEDIDLWIKSRFHLCDADKVIVHVQVLKDQSKEEQMNIEGKNVIYFGKDTDLNDVVTAHPSTSRYHCMILVDEMRGPLLLDMCSANGTKVNGSLIEPYESTRISPEDIISLGASTRSYRVTVSTDADELRRHALYEKLADPKTFTADPQETTVFVGNLAFDATETDIREMFEECGEIVEIKLPVDEATSRHRGFAFIRFSSVSELQSALRKDGDELHDRFIRVKKSEHHSKRNEESERSLGKRQRDGNYVQRR